VPIVDVGPVVGGRDDPGVAAAIDRACRDVGFFGIVGHAVPLDLVREVERLAREFFARPESEKARVAMRHGGRAWRGWFPLDGELTSGTPDHKEGYYFGRELPPTDPRVAAGRLLHGPNLWPAVPAGLRAALGAYLDHLEVLGQQVTRAISLALVGDPDALRARWFRDPVILLRLFTYPPAGPGDPDRGVGEHTDYGFLTLLWQDGNGGLEVRTADGWTAVDPDPEAFVCNIGDMLDRVTGGRYRSTPHRVRSPAGGDRLAIPFFFDPDWDARIDPLPLAGAAPTDDGTRRWDGTSVHGALGTYGEYLTAKVARVFPELGADVID
jgi:isopenicillin N synthase-like dioxygenase